MSEVFLIWGALSSYSIGGFIKAVKYKIKSNAQTFAKCQVDLIPFRKPLVNTYYLCTKIMGWSSFENMNKTQAWPSEIIQCDEGTR